MLRLRRVASSLVAIGVTSLVTMGTVGGAQAAQVNAPAPPPVVFDTGAPVPSAPAVREGTTAAGSMSAQVTAAALSPAGCTGYTMYPHKSGTQASVHGRMVCNYAVSYVGTTTVLTRDRWWGLEELNRDTSARNNSKTSYDATPHWTCLNVGTYSYRGYSAHRSIENGVSYTSNTSNWQIPGVSRFAC